MRLLSFSNKKLGVLFCLFLLFSFTVKVVQAVSVFAYSQGDVIVTEMMINPNAVTDAKGEWFEVYNTTDNTIDLNGWEISDQGSNRHTISGSLPIEKNGFVVLALNGSGAVNGGLSADYDYSAFTLSNGDDEIILTQSGGGVVDMVSYNTSSGWTIPVGEALTLINLAGDRNDPTNWTGSRVAYGDGDLGTPAVASVSASCGNGVWEQGELCDDGNSENTDACTNSCSIATCGDGFVWSGNEDCDDGGVSARCDSNCKSLITKPVVPTNFVGSVVNSKVSLVWDEVSGTTGYKVYRSSGSTVFSELFASTTSLFYLDDAVNSGNTYYYKVVATNSAGDSEMSAMVTLTVSENAVLTSKTSGQVELPSGTTSMVLTDSAVMDLSERMSSATGGSIVVGGMQKSLNNFTSGNLLGVNLGETQTVGDQSVTVGTSVKLESGTNGLPVSVTNSGFAMGQLSIPDGTIIMGPNDWNGQIIPPQGESVAGTIAPSGFSVGSAVVEVGASGQVLLFDQPVSVILEGIHSDVAYKPAGSNNWVKISATCSGTYLNPSAPIFPGECYIVDNASNKTKIYTYHLTSFANLTAVASPVSTSTATSGGGLMILNSQISPYVLPSIDSSTVANVTNKGLDLSKTLGRTTRPVLMQNTDYGIVLEIQQDTIITRNAENYSGVIEKPKSLTRKSTPALPQNYEKIFGVEIETDGKVYFSKPVLLTLPVEISEETKAENVKVFFYNEDLNQYEIVGDGGNLSKDGDFISVEINHLSKFVVMDTKGEILVQAVSETIAENIDFESIEFTDIQGHWAYSYIKRLQNLDVVKGKESGIFAPDTTTTRAELTKMVLLAFDYEVPEYVIESVFADVDASAWYAPYILKAESLGLVEGYADGTFKPNREVNRVEALKIMLMASSLEIEGREMSFSDTVEGAWYASYVSYASQKGIVSGYSDGRFGPGNQITRAEFAKIVVKALDLK